MFRALALVALSTLAIGCAHKVPVQYLQAAQVDVDPTIQRVLVVDRSQARGLQHVYDAAEGAATGESYGLDADSAAIALETLEEIVRDGRRFQVVGVERDGRRVDTGIGARPLAPHRVMALCPPDRCDAILSLDAFDSDHATAVTRSRDEDDVHFEALQDTDVLAVFRLYDGRTGAIVDERHLDVATRHTSGREDSAREATAELPYEAAVFDGAAALGTSYATRISPHLVVDHRTLYAQGHATMRTAHKAARRGNLQAAVRHWESLTADADTVLAAKALYNLAVVAEASGDLGRATKLAQQASVLGGRARMHTYVDVLARRARNDRRVMGQLGQVATR
jgi:hypothetical protein